jgi:hypothetical protein
VGAFGAGNLSAGTPVPVFSSIQSRSGTVGIQAGGDFTTRGIWAADDGLIAGAMAGFSYSDLTLNTSALSTNFALVHNLSGHMRATLTGGMVGLYATYFRGGFSTDILAKADVFSLSENFTDLLAFSAGSPSPGSFVPGFPPPACATTVGPSFFGGPFDCRYSNNDPIPVINTTVMANFNYRFILDPNYWIEPTVGVQFTATTYPNISKPNPSTVPGGPSFGTTTAAARLGLSDGDLVMVQGGARLGTTTLIDNHILMTTTLTGLAYDNVLVSGGFIATQAFNGNNLLVHADEGQVRGRGILAFNFDFGQGTSAYVLADVRGGKGLFGAGGKAGIRYVW